MVKKITIIPLLLLICLFASSVAVNKYFPNPGSDETTGWWGWSDQGTYLNQMIQIDKDGLRVNKNQTYPPGYMVISLSVMNIVNNIGFEMNYGESIFLTNQLMVYVTFIIIILGLSFIKAIVFIVATSVALISYPDISSTLYVPWSSTVTFLTTVVAYKLYNYRSAVLNLKQPYLLLVIMFFAILLSFLLHTRPQDFSILALVLALSLILEEKRSLVIFLVRILLPLLFFFLLVELLWFIFSEGLAFGNLYTESHHSFFLNNVTSKLYGIFISDYRFGDYSLGLLQKSFGLFVFVVVPIVYALFYGSIFFRIYFLLWILLYLSFSDFGPHNYLIFLLFHYFKTVYFISLYESVKFFNFHNLIKSSAVILLFLLIPVNYTYSKIDSIYYVSSDEISINLNTQINIDTGDIYFIQGIRFDNGINNHLALFTNSGFLVNSEYVKNITNYRFFPTLDGIYIHFFDDFENISHLSFTTNIKNISSSMIEVYKVNRSFL